MYKGASVLEYISTIRAHGCWLATGSVRRASESPKYDEVCTRFNISAIGNGYVLLIFSMRTGEINLFLHLPPFWIGTLFSENYR